jgi:tRNA(Ile2) C34 agmatinyltransferase TiaS
MIALLIFGIIVLVLIYTIRLPLKCPECGGTMTSDMFDMEHECLIYKCTKCGKEWK